MGWLPIASCQLLAVAFYTVRRPLTTLMMATIMASTSSRWIRPPAMWKPHPSSQRIRRMAKIVQSMNSSPRPEDWHLVRTTTPRWSCTSPGCPRQSVGETQIQLAPNSEVARYRTQAASAPTASSAPTGLKSRTECGHSPPHCFGRPPAHLPQAISRRERIFSASSRTD